MLKSDALQRDLNVCQLIFFNQTQKSAVCGTGKIKGLKKLIILLKHSRGGTDFSPWLPAYSAAGDAQEDLKDVGLCLRRLS